jgi:hypothetical protein
MPKRAKIALTFTGEAKAGIGEVVFDLEVLFRLRPAAIVLVMGIRG